MPAKILTVDDSKTIRMIIAKAFKTFDCEIIEATNGIEGLSSAAKEKPDLIILDYTMPVMDGYEMLGKLKTDQDLRTIPVVMLTAEAGKETVLKIAKLGVRDYLVKPFKEEAIIERVSRIIDLQTKTEVSQRTKRYDDALRIVVIDDKPAILDQFKSGFSNTSWEVLCFQQAGQAVDYSLQNNPDVILVSLSLPEAAAFSCLQMLKASSRTRTTPVFALSVKTAVAEQAKAQQLGIAAIITKPIDFQALKLKIGRVLNLDSSYKYIQMSNGVMVLNLPEDFSANLGVEITSYLQEKLVEGVDSGYEKLVIDMGKINKSDIPLMKMSLSALKACQELSLKCAFVCTDALQDEFTNFEETKDWKIYSSLNDAVASFSNKPAAPAVS